MIVTAALFVTVGLFVLAHAVSEVANAIGRSHTVYLTDVTKREVPR